MNLAETIIYFLPLIIAAAVPGFLFYSKRRHSKGKAKNTKLMLEKPEVLVSIVALLISTWYPWSAKIEQGFDKKDASHKTMLAMENEVKRFVITVDQTLSSIPKDHVFGQNVKYPILKPYRAIFEAIKPRIHELPTEFIEAVSKNEPSYNRFSLSYAGEDANIYNIGNYETALRFAMRYYLDLRQARTGVQLSPNEVCQELNLAKCLV